jgi:hypothetical protein
MDFPEQFPGHTYVHVIHEACQDLTHVMLQHDPNIIQLVADITLAPTLDQWYNDVLTTNKFRALTPRPRFHKPAPSPHATCG